MKTIEILLARIESLSVENERLRAKKEALRAEVDSAYDQMERFKSQADEMRQFKAQALDYQHRYAQAVNELTAFKQQYLTKTPLQIAAMAVEIAARHRNEPAQRIQMIKELRLEAYIGLKEAKDAIDKVVPPPHN